MSRPTLSALFAALLAAGLACDAAATDAPGQRKKMEMDQPMATGMTKKGMKKGDVRKGAEQKSRKLEPMMEQEEKSMPPAKAAH